MQFLIWLLLFFVLYRSQQLMSVVFCLQFPHGVSFLSAVSSWCQFSLRSFLMVSVLFPQFPHGVSFLPAVSSWCQFSVRSFLMVSVFCRQFPHGVSFLSAVSSWCQFSVRSFLMVFMCLLLSVFSTVKTFEDVSSVMLYNLVSTQSVHSSCTMRYKHGVGYRNKKIVRASPTSKTYF